MWKPSSAVDHHHRLQPPETQPREFAAANSHVLDAFLVLISSVHTGTVRLRVSAQTFQWPPAAFPLL